MLALARKLKKNWQENAPIIVFIGFIIYLVICYFVVAPNPSEVLLGDGQTHLWTN